MHFEDTVKTHLSGPLLSGFCTYPYKIFLKHVIFKGMNMDRNRKNNNSVLTKMKYNHIETHYKR